MIKGGALVSIKGQDAENLKSEYDVRFEGFFMEPDGALLANLGALIEQGAIRPVIDSVFHRDETGKA